MALAFEMEIVEALEDAHRLVGPVELVEIDTVGLEALQARLDRLHDLALALPRRRLVLAEPHHLAAARDLGRDHHLVARLPRGKPGADDRLGAALGLGL